MPKRKTDATPTAKSPLQEIVQTLDAVGSWDWDIGSDVLVADALVAAFFGVDAEQAEAGAPLRDFMAGIHPEDRERVVRAIGRCARAGGAYVAEYRVCAADGQIRWLLARGRFDLDRSGQPKRGRGIVIDITPARMSDEAYVSTEMFSSHDPLDAAADRCIAAQKAVEKVGDRDLQFLADMLLFEVGRRLAGREDQSRRRHLN
ncbi:PAS domain S-box-containing protein [Methylobacterium sp. BE186]|uniref:PAS domain-containing protein n=1 Tax=Methylobacterium sp. BE186 TaxID=2817715 RepID=UPI002866127D|nr:PAS domain-containing protein [Methylobacterium sp. BE186]MDR7036644.1 PAS domain S-box-containing protein [Methylobacterium sp. BE186]